MRVSFLNFGSDRCGGVRVLFEVMNGLAAKGHEVQYFALAPQNWFPLKVPVTVCKSPADMPNAVPESDVLVATWCATAPIVDQIKGVKGTPVYYCQHHEPIFFFTPQEQQFVVDTYRLQSLNLIANSPWLQKILKETYGRESTLIVPGVDQQVFCRKGRGNTHELPTDEKGAPLKVLAFASQTPFKGFYDTVLPAFQWVHRALGDRVEFHVYGNVADAAKLPVPLKVHGGLSDVELAELYRGCDLFVSGSWAESSPLPHLEAMACGTPVVSTMYGTEHYGESLVRVKPRAPRILGNAILDVLQNRDLREKMSLLGTEEVKPFTWQHTVNQAEAYFKSLVGEN